MSYEYSAQNRFDFPHKYMYTTYGGKKFLQEYFASREKSLNLIKLRVKAPALELLLEKNQELFSPATKIVSFLPKILFLLMQVKEKDGSANDFPALLLKDFKFSDLMLRLIPEMVPQNPANSPLTKNHLQTTQIYKLLSIFNKKFEVFRKIYHTYSPTFKKKDENWKNIYNYELLSLALLLYHAQYYNLKFLNCSLKINDLLCSVIGREEQEKELTLLFLILGLETSLIKNLMKQKGVFYDLK